MRIMYLVDGYYPGIGGAEYQATLLAKTLIQRGHHVLLVAPHLEPELPLEENYEGIPVKRISYIRIPKLSNFFYTISFTFFMLKHGRHYDAYHIHMVHKMGAVVGLLKPWLRNPVLAKVSGATEFEGGVLDFSRGAFYKRWVCKLLMRLDYFQSLSSFSKKQIVAAGAREDQIITLANGIDVSRFNLSPALHQDQATDETVFAFCGRLEPVKALHLLIEAVAKLRDKGYRDFRLEIAGDGVEEKKLAQQVTSLEVSDLVAFHGRIKNVPAFLSQAHAYVQVSRYEGLSNSVIEAMCSGLTPVLTRISGNEDLVVHGESGFLIEVDDLDALVEHMAKLIDDRAQCKQMGVAARARVERLCDLDTVVDTLETIYRGEYKFEVNESPLAESL